MAKAIALGADLTGMAHQFLQAAAHSAEKVIEKIDRTVRELRICMFCGGARTLSDLRATKLLRRADAIEWERT